MRKTLAEIAQIIEGEVVGDGSLVITGVCSIEEGQEGSLTFVVGSKYFPLIEKTRASAVIGPLDSPLSDRPIIRTKDPSLAFAKIVSLIVAEQRARRVAGIHETATLGENVSLGRDVSIGPHVTIEDNVMIGDYCAIDSGSIIGRDTVIGSGCHIYPNVVIREKITIGKEVIIHSGVVIGSDGFGFTLVDGRHEKIPQIGTVVIGDSVEICANVTIDRARFGKTTIGRGTKLDHLVHVAHNVTIGEDCLILGQVGISGSVNIGNRAILTGQVGVVGHLTIGEGVVVISQSAVTKSVAPHTVVCGSPAKLHETAQKVIACAQRLPKYVETLHELEERTERLEAQLN